MYLLVLQYQQVKCKIICWGNPKVRAEERLKAEEILKAKERHDFVQAKFFFISGSKLKWIVIQPQS